MNTKIKILLAVLSIAVLGLSWEVYRLIRDKSVLDAIVHDFSMQSEVFEQIRNCGLQTTNNTMTAYYMKQIIEFQLPDYSAGSFSRSGTDWAKYFAAAPESTQYGATGLQRMVERERSAAIADLMRLMRSRAGRDLGSNPNDWIREYATKK